MLPQAPPAARIWVGLLLLAASSAPAVAQDPAAAATPAGAPSDPRPADGRTHRADYVVRARVEEPDKTLAGEAVLTWTNGSGEPISDLWFHLYWNAFANNRSTHLWESRGRLGRRDRIVKVEDGWGWQRMRSIRFEGQELLDSLTWQQTEDSVATDRTVFSVDLPRPAAPGESVQIELEWDAQIPRVRRRTGHKGDFLFVAHWLPKLGVYEAGRGWVCHAFHANTEFYSSFGTYDVTLDLDERYAGKVGASGVQRDEPDVRDGRVVTRFLAPAMSDRDTVGPLGRTPLVHGFTWTADPRFTIHEELFRPRDWANDPRFADDLAAARAALGSQRFDDMRDVRVVVLVHEEREAQWERHFEATCAALFFYGTWFGAYPYRAVTVVDPAWGARPAGGMEYPTLFTCGTRLFTTPDMHSPESITIHEAGHQFWYGLVGNNEFEAAWLDEGLNSYADSEVLMRVYGERRETTDFARLPLDGVALWPQPGDGGVSGMLNLRRIPLPFTDFELEPLPASGLVDLWRDRPWLTFSPQRTDPRWHDRVRYLREPDADPIDRAGWKYLDRTSYSTNSYSRPAIALRSLPALIGKEAFLRGMRHFSEQWRYRHPYPDDFFAAFQQGAEVDVQWYFDDMFRGTGTVDWSVGVEQFRRDEPAGWFEDETAEYVLHELPERGDDVDGGEDSEERPWEVEISVRRRGELRLPVDVEIRYESGEVERLTWERDDQAGTRWLRLRRADRGKVAAVVIDPELEWYVDTDMSNNRWFAHPDAVAPWRWSERVLARIAHTLHWQSRIGG